MVRTGAYGRGRRCHGCRSGRARRPDAVGPPAGCKLQSRAGLSGSNRSDRDPTAAPQCCRARPVVLPMLKLPARSLPTAPALFSSRHDRECGGVGVKLPGLDKSSVRYIWRHSKRDQSRSAGRSRVAALLLRVARPAEAIVNDAIQGRAFKNGDETGPLDRPPTCRLFGGGISCSTASSSTASAICSACQRLFLLLVLINGAFKYCINIAQGRAWASACCGACASSCSACSCASRPRRMRDVKASETATMIKDEVEPIGGVHRRAFIQPVFLGTRR